MSRWGNDSRGAILFRAGCRCVGHQKRGSDEHDGHQAARGQLRTLVCYFHNCFFLSKRIAPGLFFVLIGCFGALASLVATPNQPKYYNFGRRLLIRVAERN